MITPISFFFYCSGNHRDLHSFPTRRSSDLNFSAAYALAFCAGVYFPRRLAWWLPLSAFLTTDIVMNLLYYHVAPFSPLDRKSTRLNSSHPSISYAVFCLKKKKQEISTITCT